jgi:predicted  nucleic acid-binding Zn ribbon protein
MYHNKFLKQKTDNNWEAYRKQRNLVTKLKKKTSIKTYFFDRTAGDKNIKIDKTHPSINKIETNRTNKDKLFFKPINEDFVTKQINKLNIKKATGYDGISPKIIKFAQPVSLMVG